jgi:hypothetical protein
MPLPHNIAKRGLSLEEASEYVGVSKNTMSRHGPAPIKIGDRVVYDRVALDRWLDELTGLKSPAENDPEEQLLGAIRARKASLPNPSH